METIQCTNCKTNVGILVHIYDVLTKHLAVDIKNVSPEMLHQFSDQKNEFGKIMDELHIMNPCCRISLMSKYRVSEMLDMHS